MNHKLHEAVSALRVLLDDAVKGEPKHTLQVGSILVSSWGYEQTNVDFYEVVKLLGPTMVAIREIDKKVVKQGGPSDEVVPVPGAFTGETLRKKVGNSNRLRLTSFSSASPWDGKPERQTGFGYGH